ncbi:DUF4012 domain-containing protein [Candidatus Uhrbacteria bacterium]|jgi:hypothetical protein|nr:DUF4012 domain-containing protein [Candidatus Uhrbacteria bacterium]
MDTNFIQQEFEEAPTRPKRRRTFIIIGIVIILFTASVLFGVGRIVSAAFSAGDDIEGAVESLSTLSFAEAQENVGGAIESAKSARSGLQFIGWVGYLPWVGDYFESAEILLDSGISGGEAFYEVLTIAIEIEGVIDDAEDILADTTVDGSYTFETFPDEFKLELLQVLHNRSDELYSAATKLNLAQGELAKLSELDLSDNFYDKIGDAEEVVSDLADTFEILAPIAQSLDAFAGLEQDRQWLLLFLNNTEIRPGGGFIGVYGLLQMSEGSVEQIFVDDTYNIDQYVEDPEYFVVPPQPLVDYLGVDKWYFRDANWSPDFAQSSQDSIALLRQEFAHVGQPVPQIDGVLGLTPTVMERVLGMIGPLEVDGITFEPETFTEVLEYEVEVGYKDRGIGFEDRKKIVGTLMDTLLDELFSLPIDEWPALFGIVKSSIEDKQMGLYSTDEDTQDVFSDSGWAHEVSTDKIDDILLIADANMGALKTDYAMEREVVYKIDSDENGYIAQVDITYDHQGGFDYRTTRYQTYTRVYALEGSEIISIDGSTMSEADVQNELGLVSFGAHFSVEPGEQGTLSFRYRLPQSVNDAVEGGWYQLGVFKQIGAKNHALTLDLDFGKTVRSATLSEQEDQFGDSLYHVDTIIDQDSVITIEF